MIEDLQSEDYIKYPQDIVSGRITACRYVIKACQRFLSWFDREDMEFHPEKVNKVINFVQKMKHFQAPFAGKPFILEPWQKFLVAGMFGFYWKNTDNRVIKHVILCVSRKCGKSYFAAAIGLYKLIADQEGACEVDCCAMTRQQAKIIYEMACGIVKKMDPKKKYLRPTINRIKYPNSGGYFQVLASESATLDGYGSDMFIMDECHAQKDTKLYDVLASSQAARHNPLSFICTTRGFNLTGPYAMNFEPAAIDMLEGIKQNDSLFALIYTLDDEDDYHDENCWIKCCPNLGVTVQKDYYKDRIIQAENDNSLMTDLLTKSFNKWCQSSESWLPDKLVYNAMQKVDLNKLKTEPCYGGVDLSSVSDLTSVSLMFPPNEYREYYPDKYIFYSVPYVPGEAIDESVNRDFYKRCIDSGHLRDTRSKSVDYDFILKDLLNIAQNVTLLNTASDMWNARQFLKNAQDEGLSMDPFSQSLQSFNIPTKYFEILLREGKVIIDANVVTRWCFSNAVLRFDHNDNCKPVKADDDKTKKIDVVISMLESLGIYLTLTDAYLGPANQELERNKQNQK